MEHDVKGIIWSQLGATLDMLENAIRACPDEVWSDPSRKPEWRTHDVVGFWYVVYHTLFFTDFYLSGVPHAEFMPPAPYNRDELDPAGLLPERPFPKDAMLHYLEHCRQRCRTAIETLDANSFHRATTVGGRELSLPELCIYNLRHVQHHVAQLNLILRQRTGSDAPRWVVEAREPLRGPDPATT